MEPFINKIGRILEVKVFSKSKTLTTLATKYFFFTSKITNFLLFNSLAVNLYWLYTCYVLFTNGNNYFKVLYATQMTGWTSFLKNCYLYFDWNFLFLVGFTTLLFDLAFNNTVLVSVASVNSNIKSTYGEDFIPDHGYNSTLKSNLSTANRTMGMSIAASFGFVGASVSTVYGTYIYGQNYQAYLNTLQPTQVPVPPVYTSPVTFGPDITVNPINPSK
jgi:hypothetical protein